MKIFIFQPALPEYRIDFFEKVNKKIKGKLKVFYSPSEFDNNNSKKNNLLWAFKVGKLLQIFPGIFWQKGILNIDISEADLVVVCGAPRNIATIFLLIKTKLLGIKTIWWGHFWSATSKKTLHKLRMFISNLSYSILFYTDHELEQFRKINNNRNKLAGSLNNGINNEKIIHLRNDYDSIKRENNILFIGRVTEKAKLELLIDVFKNKKLKDYKLDVIGEGPLLGVIKNKVLIEKLTKRVKFHNHSTDEKYISKVANKSALFVYPGSVGLSLIHAMTYGLPAVIHNNRSHHMPEFAAFEELVTGLSFNEDSAVDLANKIIQLMNLSKLRNKMSKNSIKKISLTYNTNDMNNRFYKFCLVNYQNR